MTLPSLGRELLGYCGYFPYLPVLREGMNDYDPPQPKTPAHVTGWDERWRVAGLCLMLAAITFAVFGQTIGFKFINFDDNLYVYDNARVTGGLNWNNFVWVFTHADCSLYHPLTMLSLMVDYQLHGLHPGGYHLTNVLFHTASVILLFLILRRMTGFLWRSAFVAALFAIHPLRAESVAWVSERKDVLSTFFFMLTIGAYIHYVRNPKSLARYLMVTGVFVLALLSKPTVVTLPFVLLLLDYWPLLRVEPRKFSGLIMEKVPFLALATGLCVMTFVAAGKEITAEAYAPLPSRLGRALVSYVVYLRQTVWPEGLAAYYPQPEKGYPVSVIALSFLLLALITGGALAFRRKRPWLLTGWFWYLGMLTPMIGIVQGSSFAHADRMTYLPQIGLFLLLIWTFADLSTGWHYRRAAQGGLAAIILVALVSYAWKQTLYWRDSKALWTHALACTKDNEVAHGNLGIALFQDGRTDEAIDQFQQALQINPKNARPHFSLGTALLQKGKVDSAITQFLDALQINPDYAEVHNSLGNALLREGRTEEAAGQFQTALQINSNLAQAHYNLGNILFEKGKVGDAIAHYQQALQIEPNYAQAHSNLASALLQEGNADEAIAQYQQALQIDPNCAPAHVNLAGIFMQRGDATDAIPHFQRALQLDPDNPEIQNNLAWLFATCREASLRNGGKAVQLAQRASELAGGKNPFVLRTLAAAFAEAGQFNDAKRSAQTAIELAQAAGQKNLEEKLKAELKLYDAGLPFHQ